MVSVTRSKDQSRDSMLRRFTKLVMDEKIVDEVRERMFYRSPSIIKKEKARGYVKHKKTR